MAETRLTCPECSATLRLKEEVPDGKWVRCPKCKSTFVPDDNSGGDIDSPVRHRKSGASRLDDDARSVRPRTGSKKRSKKKKTNPALIIVPIAIAVVLLLGGTALAIYFLGDDKKSEPTKVAAGNPPAVKGKSGVNPNAAPAGPVGLDVGNAAMEIDAEDIDGKQFKLSDYRGKVVVLDFWGHW